MCDINQRQIEDLLLMPIKCVNRKDNIEKQIDPQNNKITIIYSGQTYYSTLDEDMSDFAIKFYDILYKEILENKSVLNDKVLYNNQYAGDTMNSFNSIANLVPQAGKSKKTRTNYNVWPKYLQEYYDHYHCLANFWIIPMGIGRRGKKLNKYDSPYIFINKLSDREDIIDKYKEYFKCITNSDKYNQDIFIEKQFVCTEDITNIIDKYNNNDTESLINALLENIKRRANKISTQYCTELWSLFKELKLLT